MLNTNQNDLMGYYCYREPRNKIELKKLLHVRYYSYFNSRVRTFIEENQYGIDIDEWDKNARHFGLYHCQYGQEIPVGYMRVIVEQPQPAMNDILGIARECSAKMYSIASALPRVPFSVMDYFPQADTRIADYLTRMHEENENLCEAGRFALTPEVRSLKISRFMIECSIAVFYFGLVLHNAVISCNELHGLIYRHYGFKKVDGTSLEKIGEYPYLLLLLLLLRNKKDLPIVLRGHLENMAEEYNNNGSISLGLDRHVKPNLNRKPITLNS